MVHPAFIYVLLLLAVFTVRLGCAQNLVMQSAPLPVIEGKINGMDVVAQGDSVAFFAGKLPSEYSDKSCAENLHCTLHKNHTRAVQISPKGIRLLQLNPDHLEKDKDEDDDSSSLVLPSLTLNTVESPGTASFVELFISTEEIEPTPTLATLYTGNPVVDQTPGLAWVNSETIRLLATTVETFGFLSTSTTSTTGDDFTLVNPSSTESVRALTTITGELNELRRRLMSSATVPVPTPVQTNINDFELDDNEIQLETAFDFLIIRPSPSGQYESNSETSAFTFTVKQMGTSTESNAENTPSCEESTSTEAQLSGTTNIPLETNKPEATSSLSSASRGETAPDAEVPKAIRLTIEEKRQWLKNERLVWTSTISRLTDEQIEQFYPDEYIADPDRAEREMTIHNMWQRLSAVVPMNKYGRRLICGEWIKDEYATNYEEYKKESVEKGYRLYFNLDRHPEGKSQTRSVAEKRQILEHTLNLMVTRLFKENVYIDLFYPDEFFDNQAAFEKTLCTKQKIRRLVAIGYRLFRNTSDEDVERDYNVLFRQLPILSTDEIQSMLENTKYSNPTLSEFLQKVVMVDVQIPVSNLQECSGSLIIEGSGFTLSEPTASPQAKRQKLDMDSDACLAPGKKSKDEVYKQALERFNNHPHRLEWKKRLSEKQKQRLISTGVGVHIAPVIVPIKFGRISFKSALEKKLVTEEEWRRVREVTKENTFRVKDFDEWLRIRREGTAEEKKKLNEEEKKHELQEEKRIMLARKDRILHGQRVVVSGARPYLNAAGLSLDDLPKTLAEFKDPVEPDEGAEEAVWKEYDRALLTKKFFGSATELIGTRADFGCGERKPGGYLLADGVYYEFAKD